MRHARRYRYNYLPHSQLASPKQFGLNFCRRRAAALPQSISFQRLRLTIKASSSAIGRNSPWTFSRPTAPRVDTHVCCVTPPGLFLDSACAHTPRKPRGDRLRPARALCRIGARVGVLSHCTWTRLVNPARTQGHGLGCSCVAEKKD